MNVPPSPTRTRRRLALAAVVGLWLAGSAAAFLILRDTEPSRPAGAPAVSKPTLFVAPTGDDRASCKAASPCRSLDRALHAAKPGELVQLAAGEYRNQLLTAGSLRSARDHRVVVRPAHGAKVRLRGLRCGKNA